MVKKLCSDWLLLFWFWFFNTPLKTAIIIMIIANSYLAFIAGVLSDVLWIKRWWWRAQKLKAELVAQEPIFHNFLYFSTAQNYFYLFLGICNARRNGRAVGDWWWWQRKHDEFILWRFRCKWESTKDGRASIWGLDANAWLQGKGCLCDWARQIKTCHVKSRVKFVFIARFVEDNLVISEVLRIFSEMFRKRFERTCTTKVS